VLISINGKPADWLDLGATRDGVTVVNIKPTTVTLDTATGFRDVTIAQGGPEPAAQPVSPASRTPPPALGPNTGAAPMPSPQNALAHPVARPFGPLSLMAPSGVSAGLNPAPGSSPASVGFKSPQP
jgi:hypothetical protein